MSDLRQSSAWQQLEQQAQLLSDFSLVDAFSKDPSRADKFSFEAAGIFADFSKALINDKTLALLVELAHERGLDNAIDGLKTGEHVNNTEQRQVLHYLLRAKPEDIPENLHHEFAGVCKTREKMQRISDGILQGKRLSATGKAFTDVVHIGIGGSYLGPAMIYEALQPLQKTAIRCHFVSNICANEIYSLLPTLRAESTLFIIASKTFTTLETLCNADTAKAWLTDELGNAAVNTHFYAVTSAPEKAIDYGIAENNILAFWDWIGGRYSAFSSIGLILSIGLGYENFSRILDGARNMDQHFFHQKYNANIPVIMALIGIWYVNFHQKNILCIAPYDHRLRSLPAFLQQLEMESNGKSVTREGQPIDYPTCPTLFGESGSNCQHSYFQLLHQSPDFIPVDFIACMDQPYGDKAHHDWLIANCFAQSKALMLGQLDNPSDALSSHKAMPGNRPSTTLVLDELTPERLGALIALYEHKVFVQGVIWDINSFDQWGVELGKKISKSIHEAMMDNTQLDQIDASSQQLIRRFIKARDKNI